METLTKNVEMIKSILSFWNEINEEMLLRLLECEIPKAPWKHNHI